MLCVSFAFLIFAVHGTGIHPDTPEIFGYLSSFKVEQGSGTIVITRSPPGLLEIPTNPCGKRLYEIYSRLWTMKTARDGQVISLHILLKFVQ